MDATGNNSKNGEREHRLINGAVQDLRRMGQILVCEAMATELILCFGSSLGRDGLYSCL